MQTVAEVSLNNLDVPAVVAVAGLATYTISSVGVWLFRRYGGSRSANPWDHRRNRRGEDEKPVKVITKVVKWFHIPSITIPFLYTFAGEERDNLLRTIPSVFSNYGGALQKVLPIHPKSLVEGFQLGSLYEKAFGGATQPSAEALNAILKQVGNITGRGDITLDMLKQLPETLQQMDDSRGTVQRVLSVFSMVNILWGLSILTIAATLGPFLWVLARPIRAFLSKLWDEVIFPLLRKSRYLLQYPIYAVACLIIVESARYPVTDAYSMTGTMIGLTGLCGLGLSWAYTTFLLSDNSGQFRTWAGISTMLLSSATLPVAYIHQSTFLGYIAVGSAIWSAVLFGIESGWSLFYGFHIDSDIVNGAGACLFMTLLNATLKALNLKNPMLMPLQPAFATLGSTLYLFQVMLLSFVGSFNSSYRFHRANFVFMSNVAAYYVIGEFLGLPAVANSAKVFGGFWIFLKFCEHTPKRGEMFVVSVFSCAVFLYLGSLHLSRHPELIASLFQSS